MVTVITAWILIVLGVLLGAGGTWLAVAINRCERELRAAFAQVRWLFFEPDVEK